MKKIITIGFILCLICLAVTVNAQSHLTVKASQQYTTFKFTDTQGTKLNNEYSGIFTGAYGAGYRFISEGGVMVNGSLGMRKAGATLVYDDINYTWDLQYANAQLGFGYMLRKDNISPYISASGYYAYLLRGYQTVNNENFNLKKSKSLNEMDYGFSISPGIQIKLSDAISSFVELEYLMGLNNLEKDDGQKATNLAYSINVGLAFSFVK
ncbi:MAG: outer membrane beta-barrel protein [Bacteroidota bacterium]